MAANPQDTKPKPGRPVFKDDDSVHTRLLHAAAELFASYEFRAVSIRQIAKKAEVNTAMIHYYFEDKLGLYTAMMEQVSLPVEKALNEIAEKDELSIKEFIGTWIAALADNPWYPIFIIREGIIGKGPIRDATSERLRKSMAPAMLRALENDRKNGRIRKDLDLNLVIMSLVSALTYPFLVRPLMEKTLGLSFDHDHIPVLTEHVTDVFLHGVLDYENPKN